MRKKSSYLIWISIGIILVALTAYKVYDIRKHSKETPQKQGVGNAPVPVSGYVVKAATIENLVISNGNLLANEEVTIQSEISGRVTDIYFKEGSSVTKGSLLVKLYDKDLQAQLKKLKVQEELAIKQENRLKELVKTEAVSQQEYDVALNNLHGIQADMDLVLSQIQKTEIRAPFSGKVGLRNISTGAYVAPGTLITTLQQLQPLKLDFSIPERYSNQLSSSPVVEFSVQGINDVLTARIIATEPGIDENTRTLKIRALYDNKNLKVLPGAFASVKLPLEKIENGLMIPTQAVIPELKGQKVFISENGKASPRSIEMGLRNDSTVQVVTGINAGDTVITTGVMQVRPGSDLKFTNMK